MTDAIDYEISVRVSLIKHLQAEVDALRQRRKTAKSDQQRSELQQAIDLADYWRVVKLLAQQWLDGHSIDGTLIAPVREELIRYVDQNINDLNEVEDILYSSSHVGINYSAKDIITSFIKGEPYTELMWEEKNPMVLHLLVDFDPNNVHSTKSPMHLLNKFIGLGRYADLMFNLQTFQLSLLEGERPRFNLISQNSTSCGRINLIYEII